MSKQSPVHVGGCILNRSPNEMHGDRCDCFKIRFSACAWLEHHSVEMCREWVRYMSSSLPVLKTGNDNQSIVVRDAVCKHFGITQQWPGIFKTYPKAKAAIDAVAVLGYIPEVFREVVMCNRYGHVENHISVRHILTNDIPDLPYGAVFGRRDEKLWERNSWGYELAQHNRDLFGRFTCALHNLANNKSLTKYRSCNLSYGMNPLQAAVKLLQLKTQHHEAGKQQVAAPLPV